MNLIEGGFPVEHRARKHYPEHAPGWPPQQRRTSRRPVARPPAAHRRRTGRPSPRRWRRARGRSWVPIRSLGPRHRERIVAHLLALDPRSRYLRFGYQPSDAQIARYVDTLDFEHDEVFGIFNRRLELIAMAHLAYRRADATRGRDASAEFGVSVLPHGAAPRIRPAPVRACDAACAQSRCRLDLDPRPEREHGDAEDRPRCRSHRSTRWSRNRGLAGAAAGLHRLAPGRVPRASARPSSTIG